MQLRLQVIKQKSFQVSKKWGNVVDISKKWKITVFPGKISPVRNKEKCIRYRKSGGDVVDISTVFHRCIERSVQ